MDNLAKILEYLEKTGSSTKELKLIKEKLADFIKKEKDVDTIMTELTDQIVATTKNFYEKNNYGYDYMTGFSSGIYLPSFDDSGEVELLLFGGNSSRKNDELKVNSKTMFDVASITKLFTLILTFKLEEEKIINLDDKICDVNADFKELEDYTFRDLIRLHGDIWTKGNIANAKDEKEAFEILKTAYLNDNTRNTNKYTDFGAIIIGKTLEKIMSKREGKNVTLEDLMQKYIYNPANLTNTGFNPKTTNISGNGGYDTFVHDPKTRLLGGIAGSAGIFTNSKDLNKLAKSLYSVNYINPKLINKKHLTDLGEITFPNAKQSQKGNLGIYVKHPLGYDKTFTPSLFSNGSFAHQGWTGAVAIFDSNNNIHLNMLPNAIVKDQNNDLIVNDKVKGFMNAWNVYEKNIVENVMLMMIVKKYFNMYKDQTVNLSKQIKL